MGRASEREALISRLLTSLRDERLRQRLSINEIAVRSGLSRAMISRMEKGERLPTIDTLLRVTEALKIELCDALKAVSVSTEGQGSSNVQTGVVLNLGNKI